jgi:hypothetical protein
LFFFVNFALSKRASEIRSRLAIYGDAETDEQFQPPAPGDGMGQIGWARHEVPQEAMEHLK